MIVGGIDIGSTTSKSLAFDADRQQILGWKIVPTTPNSTESANIVMSELLKELGLYLHDFSFIVATGYGRINVPFAQRTKSELPCHAKGAHWLFPQTRTVFDVGGQDCKAIRCDRSGNLTAFVLNDKCAAGTGRYLERIAAKMNLSLEEIGPLSLQIIRAPQPISNICAIFAEMDAEKLLKEGKHVNDVLAGVHEAITGRFLSLLRKIGVEKELSITGGIAKNIGVTKRLEKELRLNACIPPESQIVGALGAALFASVNILKKPIHATTR